MRNLIVTAIMSAALSTIGYSATSHAQEDTSSIQDISEDQVPDGNPQYGCVIIVDQWGEREVCNTYFYPMGYGALYWDPFFSLWIGPHGYWRDGAYNHGLWEGYHDHYRALYRPLGWHTGHDGWWTHAEHGEHRWYKGHTAPMSRHGESFHHNGGNSGESHHSVPPQNHGRPQGETHQNHAPMNHGGAVPHNAPVNHNRGGGAAPHGAPSNFHGGGSSGGHGGGHR